MTEIIIALETTNVASSDLKYNIICTMVSRDLIIIIIIIIIIYIYYTFLLSLLLILLYFIHLLMFYIYLWNLNKINN